MRAYLIGPFICDVPVEWLEQGVLLCVLCWAAFVDCRERRIPNALIAVALCVWVALAVAAVRFGGVLLPRVLGRVLSGLLLGGGALGLALALKRKTGRLSLGGGDVKLLAVVGLYLSFVDGALAVDLACICAVGWSCVRTLVNRRRPTTGLGAGGGPGVGDGFRTVRTQTFAFAPWLLLGSTLVVARRWLV